jgi:hypothetical protein
MRNMIRVSCAIVVGLIATSAFALECSATKDGVALRHSIQVLPIGTEARCAAGKQNGLSVAPPGMAGGEIGLCVAGDWTFHFIPEVNASVATYNGKAPPMRGTRVELKCTAKAS